MKKILIFFRISSSFRKKSINTDHFRVVNLYSIMTKYPSDKFQGCRNGMRLLIDNSAGDDLKEYLYYLGIIGNRGSVHENLSISIGSCRKAGFGNH